MKFLERFWQGCGHCHGPNGCALLDQIDVDAVQGPYTCRGFGLVTACLTVFVLPLVSAIGGAFWFDDLLTTATTGFARQTWHEFAGAVLGLAIGVVIARVVLWVVKVPRRAPSGESE